MSEKPRVVLGVSGASGAALALAVAARLRATGCVETHLVISRAARRTLLIEAGREAVRQLEALADKVHAANDLAAPIASGSFRTAAMIVAPCSMRTLGAIASGIADNLLVRAADVHLKERRRLVLMARESPLHLGHLRQMTAVTEMGGIIAPPVPPFYLGANDIGEMVDQMAARAIDLLGLDLPQQALAWGGEASAGTVQN